MTITTTTTTTTAIATATATATAQQQHNNSKSKNNNNNGNNNDNFDSSSNGNHILSTYHIEMTQQIPKLERKNRRRRRIITIMTRIRRTIIIRCSRIVERNIIRSRRITVTGNTSLWVLLIVHCGYQLQAQGIIVIRNNITKKKQRRLETEATTAMTQTNAEEY